MSTTDDDNSANTDSNGEALSGPSHDVFLSHNSRDKEFVRELATRLKDKGIKAWLDEWDLLPGDQIQRHLSKVLDSVPVVVVVLGPGGIGPWHNAEIEVAIQRRVYDTSDTFRVIPVLMPGVARGDRNTIPAFLRDTLWVEFRDDRPFDKSFRELVRGIIGWRSRNDDQTITTDCPYRGLEYFDVEHAQFFHGRGALTQWLLDKLRKQPGGGEPNRMLAILGASGSGKSSLARAGVLAKIKDGELPGSENWPQVIVRPGPDPLNALATAFVRERSKDQKTEASANAVLDECTAMGRTPKALSLIVDLWLREQETGRRVVLLVDQFEELFSLAPEFTKDQGTLESDDQKLRLSFVQNLYHAATVPQGRLIVIIAMRADFYHKCAAYDELPRLFSGTSQELVRPLNEVELRDVIERPAWQAGRQVEPGLVRTLIQEVRGQRGNLPLLQFALAKLWNSSGSDRLTAENYPTDGLAGFLNRSAEDLFKTFSSEERKLSEQLFLRLIQPGLGTEDTKRRVSWKELDFDSEASNHAIHELLKKFSDKETRLVVTDGEGVEIAHEALVRGWDTLRKWIKENRRSLYEHRRLTEAANEWDAASHNGSSESVITGLLYRTPRLEAALELRNENPDWLSPLEKEFVEASEAAMVRERQEMKLRRERELADAKYVAEQAEKNRLLAAESAAQFRQFTIGLAVLFVLAAANGIWGWISSGVAQRERVTANREARRSQIELARNDIGNARFAVTQSRLDDALTWFERAVEHAPSDSCLHDSARGLLASWAKDLYLTLVHEEGVSAVAFSPDGQTIITGSGDKTARLWNSLTGAPRAGPLKHEGSVLAVAFSPDGQTVVTGSEEKNARIWNAQTGAMRGEPLKHDGSVLALAFSPDGQKVVTGSKDHTARLWNSQTSAPCGEPLKHFGPVNAVAFSPDGQTVVTGSWDTTARLWNANTGVSHGEPLRHDDAVNAVAFSPDGQTIVTGCEDNSARLWNAQTGVPRGDMLKHDDAVNAVGFSPDSQTVVTGSEDKSSRLWDAKTGVPRGEPLKHDGIVRAVAFSPDGQSVVTGSDDKSARLWSAQSGSMRGKPLKHHGRVLAIAISPDGQSLVTGSDDNVGRLWNAQTGAPRGELLKHDGIIKAVEFSPDGRSVVTGSWDNTARLWNAQTGAPRGGPLKHDGIVRAVAFSPDGQTVVTGSEDKSARLWNALTCAPRGETLKHNDRVVAVSFSPDGQTVITGSDDKTARLWNAKTGAPRGEPLKHDDAIVSLAFNPNGETVVTGSADKTARLWNAKTGVLRCDPLKHEGRVVSVAFSPNGETVVTGSEDTTARLWNAQTGAPRGEPLKHVGVVWTVAYSPDGRTVVTGSSVNTVQLWNTQTGTPRGEPFRHDESVRAIAFSPDGQTVVTGSEDKSARLWTVVPPASSGTPGDLDPYLRLRLSVEVRTGKHFDKNQGIPVRLSVSELNDRRMKLEELGGPNDVRTWGMVSDEEKARLRKPARVFDDEP